MVRRVCDLENLVNEEAIGRVGLQRHVKKKIQLAPFLPSQLYKLYLHYIFFAQPLLVQPLFYLKVY
jgi:hypothetical protein